MEIESLEEFDLHIRRTKRLFGWFVQSVDLTQRESVLVTAEPHGAVFLGCALTDRAEAHLRRGGALIFPRLPALPFDPYRGALYTAQALYSDLEHGYATTPDALVYAWTRSLDHPPATKDTLAMSLHDHAIDNALTEVLTSLAAQTCVGVMGEHAAQRGTEAYATAATLGLRLAATGRTVLTGGGPGAMEATNLGAYLSAVPAALPEALDTLAAAPGFTPPTGVDAWARAAFEVRDRYASSARPSLGVPTWFYGHEPPNVFATLIAKYFSNAIREDSLLSHCRGGIVYLPGNAGTVQEIFTATTESFYATETERIAPLVLVGRRYWTETRPAWPLLRSLAEGRVMEPKIHLVDSVDEVMEVLG